jgi:hypothetical protein
MAGVLGSATLANLTVPYYGAGGGAAVSTFATASISTLSVSSINGQSAFVSSVQGVSLPATTSTLLCQVPLGNFSYQIASSGPGDSWMNSGIGGQVKVGPAWFGNLGADIKAGATNASPLEPYIEATQTSGLLSVGVANPTSSTISLLLATFGALP